MIPDHLSLNSNIESKSWNNTYLNIILIEASYFDQINMTENWLEYHRKNYFS